MALEFAVRGLMLVWTLPRTAKRLDGEQRDILSSLANVDFQQHSATIHALFLSHLGRANVTRVHTPLNKWRKIPLCRERDGSEVMDLSYLSKSYNQGISRVTAKKKNPKVRECSGVICWSGPLERDSFSDASKGTIDPKQERWTKYDTLNFNDEEENSWKYDYDWNFLGQQAEYAKYGVKLLQAVSGKYLFLDATYDDKHIWHFAGKFEHFVRQYCLRPIDILLLFIGIQIEFHDESKHLFPRNFGVMLDVVQHREWKCQVCNANDLRRPDFEHFYYCRESTLYLCAKCERSNACPGSGRHEHVKFKTKPKAPSGPSLSLFTLLLAGRVRTTNLAPPSDILVHRDVLMEVQLGCRMEVDAQRKQVEEKRLRIQQAIAVKEELRQREEQGRQLRQSIAVEEEEVLKLRQAIAELNVKHVDTAKLEERLLEKWRVQRRTLEGQVAFEKKRFFIVLFFSLLSVFFLFFLFFQKQQALQTPS